jgi:hypothetical protein
LPLRTLSDLEDPLVRPIRTKQALGAEILTRATEWTGSALLSIGARLMTWGTPFNAVIAHVPGPRAPLYLLGSQMLEIHPHVPIMGTLGIGVALFSYEGTLSCAAPRADGPCPLGDPAVDPHGGVATSPIIGAEMPACSSYPPTRHRARPCIWGRATRSGAIRDSRAENRQRAGAGAAPVLQERTRRRRW